jgi:hypothetical protein
MIIFLKRQAVICLQNNPIISDRVAVDQKITKNIKEYY